MAHVTPPTGKNNQGIINKGHRYAAMHGTNSTILKLEEFSVDINLT